MEDDAFTINPADKAHILQMSTWHAAVLTWWCWQSKKMTWKTGDMLAVISED